MGYTNETTHYGIPLPLGSDLTTPMDYNNAAEAVDEAVFEAVSNSSGAVNTAAEAVQAANAAATTAAGAVTEAQTAHSVADAAATAAGTAQNTANAAETSINSLKTIDDAEIIVGTYGGNNVYRKRLTGSNSTPVESGNRKIFQIDLTALGVNKPLRCQGFVTYNYTGGSSTQSLGSVGMSVNDEIQYCCAYSSAALGIQTSTGFSGGINSIDYDVVIEYLK